MHRVDIDPVDEARAYQKRMDVFGWSATRVAEHARVSIQRVSARLKLLSVVPCVQDLIQKGHMSVKYGEAMADLDQPRQMIAFRYLNTSEKPLLRHFSRLVGELLEQQAQEALFDLTTFFREIEEEEEDNKTKALALDIPVDDSLPLMPRKGTIGQSFERYMLDLIESGDPHARAAVPVIGRIYQSMLASGQAYWPKNPQAGTIAERWAN